MNNLAALNPINLLNALRNAGFRIKNESEENAALVEPKTAIKTVATKNNVRLLITYAAEDLRVPGPADGTECDVFEQRLTNIGGWARRSDYSPLTDDDLIAILKRASLPRKKVKGGPEMPVGYAFGPTIEHGKKVVNNTKLRSAEMLSVVCLDDRLKCVDGISHPDKQTFFLLACESARGGQFEMLYDSTSRMWWAARTTQGRTGNTYACERHQAEIPKAIDILSEADEELIRSAISYKLSNQ